MSDIRERLVWFLSDPTISDSELRLLERWLRAGGIDECLEEVWESREAIRMERRRMRRPPAVRHADSRDESPIVVEVSRLLRSEAKLTAKDATAALLRTLGGERRLPNKIAFSEAIQRLADDVGPSVLLSAANQIRNEYVHALPRSQWRLLDDSR